jgi:site-specific recombinase
MATLTPTLTLVSTDILTDSLSLSVTDSLSITGSAELKRIVTSTSSTIFAAASSYTKAYVYLKNISSTANEIITVEQADSGDEYFTLGAGEFAFFPWAAVVDLFADAATGTPTLEFGIFEA